MTMKDMLNTLVEIAASQEIDLLDGLFVYAGGRDFELGSLSHESGRFRVEVKVKEEE